MTDKLSSVAITTPSVHDLISNENIYIIIAIGAICLNKMSKNGPERSENHDTFSAQRSGSSGQPKL